MSSFFPFYINTFAPLLEKRNFLVLFKCLIVKLIN